MAPRPPEGSQLTVPQRLRPRCGTFRCSASESFEHDSAAESYRAPETAEKPGPFDAKARPVLKPASGSALPRSRPAAASMQGHTNRGSDSNLEDYYSVASVGWRQTLKPSHATIRRGRRHGRNGQVLTQMESTSATPSRSRRVGMPDRPNVGTERTPTPGIYPGTIETQNSFADHTDNLTSGSVLSQRAGGLHHGEQPRRPQLIPPQSAPPKSALVPTDAVLVSHDIYSDYYGAEARTVAARER